MVSLEGGLVACVVWFGLGSAALSVWNRLSGLREMARPSRIGKREAMVPESVAGAMSFEGWFETTTCPCAVRAGCAGALGDATRPPSPRGTLQKWGKRLRTALASRAKALHYAVPEDGMFEWLGTRPGARTARGAVRRAGHASANGGQAEGPSDRGPAGASPRLQSPSPHQPAQPSPRVRSNYCQLSINHDKLITPTQSSSRSRSTCHPTRTEFGPPAPGSDINLHHIHLGPATCPTGLVQHGRRKRTVSHQSQ